MTAGRHFTSLTAAMEAFRVPLENRDALWHIERVVGGISDYYVQSSYIVAFRADGDKVPLHMGLGTVSGFHTEEEAKEAAQGRGTRPSDRAPGGLWIASLPVVTR